MRTIIGYSDPRYPPPDSHANSSLTSDRDARAVQPRPQRVFAGHQRDSTLAGEEIDRVLLAFNLRDRNPECPGHEREADLRRSPVEATDTRRINPQPRFRRELQERAIE